MSTINESLGCQQHARLALYGIHLKKLVKQYGFERGELTVDCMLAYAMAAEQTCKDIGGFDPAYQHFKQQQLDFEKVAEFIEKGAIDFMP